MITLRVNVKNLVVLVGIVTGTFLSPQSSLAWDPMADAIEAAGNAVGGAGEELIDAYKSNTRITNTNIVNKATVDESTIEVGGYNNYLNANLGGIDISKGVNIKDSHIEVNSRIKKSQLRVSGSRNVVKTNVAGVRIK